MSLARVIQTNFTSGVVDPKMAAREDIVFFYNALQDGKNLIVKPLGGITRRPATQYLCELPPKLLAVDISGATCTAPQGGTANNIKDGDDTTYVETTVDLGTINPYVVVHIDLGAAEDIAAVDIVNYSLSGSSLSDEFFIQYSTNDSDWTSYSDAVDIASSDYSRRRSILGSPVTARYWRFARIGATSTAETVNIAEMRFFEEDSEVSDGKLMPFAYSTTASYMFVATDQNITVLKGADYVASIYSPHVAAQLDVLNYTQTLDTMLEFHAAAQPWKIFRQGGDTEFDFRYAEFENILQYDYGAEVSAGGSAGVDEVQTITGLTSAIDYSLYYYITLGGQTTGLIHGSSNQDVAASYMQAKLRALSNTSSSGITVAATSATDFTVTFGGDDGDQPWEKMVLVQTAGSVERTVVGEYVGQSDNNETQTLTAINTAAGNVITLEFEGHKTTSVTIAAAAADTATAIQTALRALENVDGDTGLVVNTATNGFAVVFSGDELGNKPHVAIQVFVLSGSSVWDIARTTEGQYPGEDIMSSTRGWPRCGIFYQARLHLCGIEGVPDAWIASVVGDRYNFDTTLDSAVKGLSFRAETDQVGAVYQIVAGQYLTMFMSNAESYVPQTAINDESVIKNSTRVGSKEGMPVFEIDGVFVYVQGVFDADTGKETGTSLSEFTYDELQQKHQSNILSKFAANLINDPVDAALRQALSTEDSSLYLMVNGDGTALGYTMLRSEKVSAFMPITVRDGDSIKNVAVDKTQGVYWITERIINGTARRYLEYWNDDLYLDCGKIETMTYENFTATLAQAAYTWTFDNPGSTDEIGVRINGTRLEASDYTVNLGTKTVTLDSGVAATVAAGDTVRVSYMVQTVTGADHLEGETIQTFVDGIAGSDVTVSSGSFTLSGYADTEIQYGFDFEVSGKLMPLRVPNAPTLVGKKVRVVNAYFELFETANLEVKANDESWKECTLSDASFTGNLKLEGLRGFAIGAPLEFRQPEAGAFTLLAVTREVSL